MQILVAADIHYSLKQMDWLMRVAADFDAVVIAGDLLEIASSVDLDAQIVVVRAYLKKLAGQTRLIVCSGNHDLNATTPGGERIADWLGDLGHIRVVGDGARVLLGGLTISAVPWWDGDATRARVGRQLERDAAEVTGPWIWVYHAPPSDSPTSWGGSRHFGDPALRDWIDRHQPDIVLCGHVHQAPFVGQGSWADRIGATWVFNMGQQPGDMPSHIIMDPLLGKAMWHSIAGTETLDLRAEGARPQTATRVPDWIRA